MGEVGEQVARLLVTAFGDVGVVLVPRIERIVDGDEALGAQAVLDAEEQLDVVDDVRPADHADLRSGREQGGEVLGHVRAVVEVRVDDAAVDGEVRALEREHRDAGSPRLADGFGGIVGVEDVDDDGVDARRHAGPNGVGLQGLPVGLAEIGVDHPGLDLVLGQPVGETVGDRIDAGVGAVIHGVDVEGAHFVLPFASRVRR